MKITLSKLLIALLVVVNQIYRNTGKRSKINDHLRVATYNVSAISTRLAYLAV